MTLPKDYRITRRTAIAGFAAGAGFGAAGIGLQTEAAELPLETRSIRLHLDPKVPIVCYAPMYLASDFLRLEGFTDISYSGFRDGLSEAMLIGEGDVDFAASFSSDGIVAIERGAPVVFVGGVHQGCIEIFADESVAGMNDLGGRRLIASSEGGAEHIMLSLILTYIGLDPQRDVEWVFEPDYLNWMSAFLERRVDVIFTSPTFSYQLRDKKSGHVILNTTLDDPWRHHLCCMLMARREFAENYPVATKRVIRAFMKATDLCASDPERVTRLLVERSAAESAAHARTLLGEIPYGSWRDYDLRSTILFFALRLREAGLIESTPRQVLENGTMFAFADQLAKEMKS